MTCVTVQLDVYGPVSSALRAAKRYDYHEWLSEADPMPGIIDVADLADPTLDALYRETRLWR